MKLVFIPLRDNPWFHPLESCPFEIVICRSKAASSLPRGLVFFLKLCTCVKCVHPHLAWGSVCKITSLQCLTSHPCPALTNLENLVMSLKRKAAQSYHLQTPSARTSQVALVVKNPPANAGYRRDSGLIPGSGRSPGGEHGNHSTILAWRIPWTDEPGGLQSMGSQRVRHDWSDLAHMKTPRVWASGIIIASRLQWKKLKNMEVK